MAWRYRAVVLLVLLLMMVLISACGDPRPIRRLPAPTPIAREVGPTPTLVPELAAAAGEEQVATAPGGGEQATLPVPPARPVAAEGQQIFAQNCAACHGADGKGVVQGTPNFADPAFWRERTPAESFQVITDGRGAMPAWKGTLDEQQRWNVLFYAFDFAVDEETLATGQQIFAQSCAACHGADGKGVVQGTPDFTDPAYLATTTMAQQFEVVTNGRGAMPAWGNQLSEDERWAVIMYIRTLGYDSTRQP